MNSENAEPVEVTVEACCEACAKTHLMVAQIHGLIDGLMNSPMVGAMFGAPAPHAPGGMAIGGGGLGGLFPGIPPVPRKG